MNYVVSLSIACLLFISTFLSIPSQSHARNAQPIKLVEEFIGTLPGSPLYGDIFGSSLGINGKFFIIGSPGASPEGAEQAGAVYFLHKSVLGDWEELQPPFFIPFQNNWLSNYRISTRGDWLFVSLTGTPSNSNVKDNVGEVLAFKRFHETWGFVQTIQNPQPLNNNGFGAYLSYYGEDWLLVGASQSNVAYFYQWNKQDSLWELAQTIDLIDTGSIFVSLSADKALITSPQSTFPTTQNGQVLAYRLKDGVWNQIQTLQGNSPLSTLYNTGDSFGSYTALYHNWAIIGAPTDNVMADLAGAAYFYHYSEKQKEWVLKDKFYSDWPSVFFGATVGIDEDHALVADPGKTIITSDSTRNIFQGAVNVYLKHPVCWDIGKKVWSCVETLIDPEGRPYDFLGGTGLDVNDHFVGIGTSTILDSLLPNGFPGKRDIPYDPLPNDGKALLYRIKHKN